MKTCDQIITGMCYTFRHDYGLLNEDEDSRISSGMTRVEQEVLFSKMSQVFKHDVKDVYTNASRFEKMNNLTTDQLRVLFVQILEGASLQESIDKL